MALTRTAAQLETSARQRADMVGSSFRDSAAVRQYLSESCRAFVSKLVDAFGDDYWSTSIAISSVANQNFLSLASVAPDAWKIVRILLTLNGYRDKLDLAGIDEIDTENVFSPKGWSNGMGWPKYRPRADKLWWSLTPTAIHSLTLEYVPTKIFSAAGTPTTDLVNDTDTFDGVFGWDTWAVLDTAIKLKSDENKDADALREELERRTEEIMSAAAARVVTEPERVRDNWRGGSRDYDTPYPWVDR